LYLKQSIPAIRTSSTVGAVLTGVILNFGKD